MMNKVVTLSQFIAFFILKLVKATIVEDYRGVSQMYGQKKDKVIFAINHASRLDGFSVISVLGGTLFQNLMPFGVITNNVYLDTWWKRLILMPLGLYPAKPIGKIQGGLEKSQKLIEDGYSMFIFPEGTRTIKGQARPRKGVVVLATKNQMPILPVHIEWKKVGKRRKKADITFGSPYCLLPNRDFDELAHFVVEQIYSL